MKKYILLLAIAGLISSCYKLDQYPHDQLSSATFWQTEVHARQGMMSVYNIMHNDNVFGAYFWQDNLGEIGYDNVWHGGPIIKGTYNDRTAIIQAKWQYTYEGIARANVVLQHIDDVQIPEELKAQYKAEAKFMRALYYFHLLDFYGGVPLYDETTIISNEFMDMKKPRTTTEETRNFILADLQEAINVLPVRWPQSEYGRATRGSAVALRGKVKLYAKDYAGATTDFEQIVNDPNGVGYGYALYPDYAKLFTPEGDASTEMIFAIQNTGGTGTEYGMPFGLRLGSRSSYGSCWNTCMPTDVFADMYENADGTKFNWDDHIPGFTTSRPIQEETFKAALQNGVVSKYPEKKDLIRQIYTNRDPRMEQTLITPYSFYYGANGTVPMMMEFVLAAVAQKKFRYVRIRGGPNQYLLREYFVQGDINGTLTNREHVPINFPLIRYADVLLMLAECRNELNRPDEAVALINQVRQRPSTNMPALNSGPNHLEARTKAEIFDRIVHERAIELACEGHRFGDLKRWGLCEERLNFVYDDLLGMPRYTRIFVQRDYLWPLPAVEYERNADLGQNNPGW